ncbi:protein-glutamate methylesterase/protein-glutamine glutaminase [Uliginosibacterium gangwonense]|uniref:protein-glutamate methylesterase/protein-glutamine glutaminase n=1 Tax=Uliginosibacterium gangwonense TaxID=392736 RepID=UPI000363224C|nr:chemotaxis response regulator protein-glutamate methylesterase [Uliginosibacterium gangwonense]
MNPKIRVLVIDDSALIRHLLTEIINRQPDLEVVGAAPDPLVAREMIRSLNPDVLTLDVEMPKMDGLDFLGRLMRLRPMPVVMISTMTERGSDTTLRALELGAVDFISKPRTNVGTGLEEYALLIAEKIRTAAAAKIRRNLPSPTERYTADAILPATPRPIGNGDPLIFIGASTGGTEAIKAVLLNLPTSLPGILVTQHMPEGFTKSYAQRLDSLCKISVKEAEEGDRIQRGHAYIAPGHSHMMVKRVGNHYVVSLNQGLPVNRHRPSVDVLFRSAANVVGKSAIGIILTGMGRDGATGMREMHEAGAFTISQNKDTCIVYGMPKEAVLAGGVDEELPLEQIGRRLLSLA